MGVILSAKLGVIELSVRLAFVPHDKSDEGLGGCVYVLCIWIGCGWDSDALTNLFEFQDLQHDEYPNHNAILL